MPQISQQVDGTYTKSYSDVELAIIKELQAETIARIQGDEQLWIAITTLDNRVTALEQQQVSLTNIQAALEDHTLLLDNHDTRLSNLENTVIIESYSKTEMDKYIVPWKVEEISHVLTVPTNDIFNNTKITDIKSGYVHFKDANINEPLGYSLKENSMRRYSIKVYTPNPKVVDFYIKYADVCNIYLNDKVVATYEGENFTGTAKLMQLSLPTGWSSLQFLVANGAQDGGLVVDSNLSSMVEKFSNIDTIKGVFTIEQLQKGVLNEDYFSPDMTLQIKQLLATSVSIPAIVAGDGYTGSIQIGDSIITKRENEPFIFDGDVQITGKIKTADGIVSGGGSGDGLTTGEREKLDTVSWNAEENQFAFSYIQAMNMIAPPTSDDPLYNVINADAKMDSLQILGANHIIVSVETNALGQKQLVIKDAIPEELITELEEEFITTEAQSNFVLTVGEITPEDKPVVYIEGIRQTTSNFILLDNKTIQVAEPLPAGLQVLVTW